jgi:hypothetical protein
VTFQKRLSGCSRTGSSRPRPATARYRGIQGPGALSYGEQAREHRVGFDVFGVRELNTRPFEDLVSEDWSFAGTPTAALRACAANDVDALAAVSGILDRACEQEQLVVRGPERQFMEDDFARSVRNARVPPARKATGDDRRKFNGGKLIPGFGLSG